MYSKYINFYFKYLHKYIDVIVFSCLFFQQNHFKGDYLQALLAICRSED